MALSKIAEARELDDQALDEAIVATKRRLFELRFQKATRQLESGFHQFKHERHRLAQLMTVRQERLLATEQSVETTETTEIETVSAQAATTSAAEEE